MIGLTVTVIIGITLGLGMVFMATSAPASPQADESGQGHEDAEESPHAHSDAGVVAMPGLQSSQPAAGSDASGGGMAGMSDADMAAMGEPAPAQPVVGDPMAGMSAEDMAAMGQQTPAAPIVADPMAGMSDEDMAARAHSGPAAAVPTRPLAATLAGFALLNISVLIAAVVIGRRRKGHLEANPGKAGPSSRRRAQSPPMSGAAPVQSATESAGSPS